MARLTSALALLLVFASSVQSQSPPTWHGIDGQVLTTGSFSGANSESVNILKPDKTTAGIPLGKLSAADRAFVLTHGDKDSEFQRTSRQWTSASGQFHVDAKAILIDGPNVRLTRADAKVINVPIDKLSSEDRSYLDRLQSAIRPATEVDPFGSVEAFTGTPPASTGKATAAVPPTAVAGDPIVYVTKSGTKYHTEGCRSLAKSSTAMPLSEAAKRYSPCSICHPPTVAGSETADATTKTTRTTTKKPSSSSLAPMQSGNESFDRNPNGETSTGQTATGIPTYTGPRGGQYHYSKSGKKVYEKKK